MKLNYLQLIINFWKTRRKKRITSLQADLYMFLIQECNQQDWENPFECSNGTICTTIGISEKSLIDARNRLKQLGLIDFENGQTKRKSPVYYLLEYWNKVSIEGGNPVSNQGGNEANTIKNKPNQAETKQNKSSSGKKPDKKKDHLSTLYWEKLVEAWFTFYKKNYLIDPTFNAAAGKQLKNIVARLKKLTELKGYEWTEEHSVTCLNHFLVKAQKDDWLSRNFLLSNLDSKFDTIVNPKNDGTTKKTGQQSTGGNIDVRSAFEKIDILTSETGAART